MGNGVKLCSKCGDPNDRGGTTRLCTSCFNPPAYLKAQFEKGFHQKPKHPDHSNRPSKKPIKVRDDGKVWCLGCNDYISPNRFNKYNNQKRGVTYAPRCKRCQSAFQHQQRLRYAYGIDGEEYYRIFDYQGGVCFICHKKPHKMRLAVDHDHKTGEVRGLLCKTCNRDIIGSAKDEIAFLERAIDYLKNPPARRLRESGDEVR
ncbi:endonuclease VII domain-containing protein [Flavobacterium sp.]|uniref:endonuclease VII domain-containing protein n=1 Tax=Flavobacterium sp. TaxID=239 RepID=UPI0037BF96D7